MSAPVPTSPGPDPSIDLQVDDGIAWVTMRNPAKLNALTARMVDEQLPDVCGRIESDERVRAVVLTGEGGAFCSGADRDDHLSHLRAAGPGSLSRPLGGFVLPLARLTKPVVAAVNGTVAGGGLALALVCDVRVGVADARLVAAYAPAGLVPDGGLSMLLPRAMGHAAAVRFLLGGWTLDGREALASGLLDQVVDDVGELRDRAGQLARSLSSSEPEVVTRTKQLLTAEMLPALEAHIQRESDHQWACLQRRGGRDDDAR